MRTNSLRDELIDKAYGLVAIEARRFNSLPRGVSVDDLESLGGEALIEAAANYDPDGGSKWLGFARLWLRNAMRSFLQRARVRAKRSAPLEIETEDGDFLPRADVRVADPAAIAEAREMVLSRRPYVSQEQLERSLPSPAEVANQVTALRSAMFSAISEQDVSDVMRAVVDRAKKGSARDARLLVDLLAPAKSGVTVHQQAVVIQQGDVG